MSQHSDTFTSIPCTTYHADLGRTSPKLQQPPDRLNSVVSQYTTSCIFDAMNASTAYSNIKYHLNNQVRRTLGCPAVFIWYRYPKARENKHWLLLDKTEIQILFESECFQFWIRFSYQQNNGSTVHQTTRCQWGKNLCVCVCVVVTGRFCVFCDTRLNCCLLTFKVKWYSTYKKILYLNE